MLSELAGKGWTVVDPPEPMDDSSVVARHNGEPIKAGVMMEELQDSPDVAHLLYRSGKYDLEVKIDFDIGRGQVKVERADGYED
jgi:hypothetical protein